MGVSGIFFGRTAVLVHFLVDKVHTIDLMRFGLFCCSQWSKLRFGPCQTFRSKTSESECTLCSEFFPSFDAVSFQQE